MTPPDRPDRLARLGRSLVQHGPANDRVYLMKLDRADLPGIVGDMERLGRERGYGKLFARVPGEAAEAFAARGFVREARVPGLWRGRDAGCFMAKYRDPGRARPRDPERLAEVLRLADAKRRSGALPILPPPGAAAKVEPLRPDHADALAGLYASVFATYPFPIHDPAWLRRAMGEGTAFFGLFRQGRLAAAASAEVDAHWRCAEMTDFATAPELRGQGAAGRLLARMEREVARDGVLTAYTIARAASPGMNIVFARAGYRLGGTLPNNTQIAGRLESMNVWHKTLPAPETRRGTARDGK
ncbi:MAG: putative beta-lysine N-acetyltransferase [Desulfovibrionaceae bacterium]